LDRDLALRVKWKAIPYSCAGKVGRNAGQVDGQSVAAVPKFAVPQGLDES
jgi:hypothetical protein